MRKRMLIVSGLVVGCVLFASYTYANCGGCGPKTAEKVTCPLSILAKLDLTEAQQKQVAPLKEAYLKAMKAAGGVACPTTKSKQQKEACVKLCTQVSALLTDAQKATLQKLCPELKKCGDGCAAACCAK